MKFACVMICKAEVDIRHFLSKATSASVFVSFQKVGLGLYLDW